MESLFSLSLARSMRWRIDWSLITEWYVPWRNAKPLCAVLIIVCSSRMASFQLMTSARVKMFKLHWVRAWASIGLQILIFLRISRVRKGVECGREMSGPHKIWDQRTTSYISWGVSSIIKLFFWELSMILSFPINQHEKLNFNRAHYIDSGSQLIVSRISRFYFIITT